MSELLFPEITEAPAARTEIATAAAGTIDIEKVDLKKLALARFGDWRADTAATKADLARTALDLSNQSRVNEAKSLRERTINVPLAKARATAKGIKSKMADTSKAVGAELEAIEAAWTDVATAITPQIEAAQARLDKAARLAAEAEAQRVAEIREHITVIRGYLAHCDQLGMTSERIANGIAALESLVIDHGTYAEFEHEALKARDDTLAAMWRLHTQAAGREQEAARQEAIRLENERIAAELKAAQERINAEAAAIRRQAEELAAQRAESERQRMEAAREAAEKRMAPAYGAALARSGLDAAYDTYLRFAGDHGRKVPLDKVDEYIEALNALQAPDTPGQDGQQVLKAEAPGPDATDRPQPATTSPRVGAMGAGQPADAGPVAEAVTDPVAIREAIDADDAPPEPKPAPLVTIVATPDMAEKVLMSPLKLAQDLEHAHALLRDALALAEHAASAFSCKFPSQPKPSVEWWAGLKERAGTLTPKLLMTLAQQQEAA